MAVRMSRFCRFRLSENSEFCSTIFSSSSISSLGRSAVMKALTVVDTTSGFLVSGRATCTTASTSCRRCSFSSVRTVAHSSRSCRSTR